MTDGLKQMLEKAKNDENLVKKLSQCTSAERVVECLNENGYNINCEDLMELLHSGDADEMKDLTIDELDTAAGGDAETVVTSVGLSLATFGLGAPACADAN